MHDKAQIYHLFQPIISCSERKIFGFEALIRHKRFHSPESLFSNAREKTYLFELDTFSIEKAFDQFEFLDTCSLFINVFPTTLVHSQFPFFIERLMEKRDVNPRHVVFELNESIVEQSVWDCPILKKRISWMRQLGFLVALDDLGTGVSSLKNMVEIEPDVIKLDRFFSNKLAQSTMKQELISLFLSLSESLKSMLILEGIECPEDFHAAYQLQVPFLQGNYIGKPFHANKLINNSIS